MENMIQTVAAAAVGMAIGGATVYAATQDHRQIRRTVHRLSRGAEKALIDFDRCNLVRRTEKGRLRRRGWGLRWEKAQKGGKGTNLRGFFED